MADKLDLTGITFDPELPEPLYLQLADALHERIKYHTGESCVLPSQRIAASMLQIDRSTAAKAYAELERRKVVSHVSSYKWVALPEARKVRKPFPNIAVVIPRRLSDYLYKKTKREPCFSKNRSCHAETSEITSLLDARSNGSTGYKPSRNRVMPTGTTATDNSEGVNRSRSDKVLLRIFPSTVIRDIGL